MFFFILQESEFSNCVDTDNIRLPATGVCVIWKWNWLMPASSIHSNDEETKPDDSDSDAEVELVNASKWHPLK